MRFCFAEKRKIYRPEKAERSDGMKENKMQHDLTHGDISKKLVLFFLPIAVGTLFQQFYNTVDAMVVGRYVGKEALAAVGGSAAQVIALCVGFFVALTGGASAVIAQLMGAQQERDVSDAVHSALAFSIVAGLIMTVIGVPFASTLLQWMQTPADTMQQSVIYLQVYLAGTVFMLLFNMGSSILRAVGDSKHPFYYLVICCVCNIILDLVLVVQFNMGVAGAALATVISQFLSTILVLQRLCRTKDIYKVNLKQLKIHRRVTERMLRIGVPTGLQESMYNVANLIIQVAINSLGTVAVAGWSITCKLDGIYVALSSALGVAVMSFVGQNFGAGHYDRVRQLLRVSMKIFLPVTLLVGGFLLWMSETALFIFTDDPAVMECTRQIMWILVPFYLMWTIIEGVGGVLRGVGDAIVPFIITCVGVCVTRLSWVIFVFPHLQTLGGLLVCWPLSWTITAVAMLWYYRRGTWLTKQLEDEMYNEF